MPWKETCAMTERMRFVTEYESGRWALSELCRIFGISRPTAYEWLKRFAEEGAEGLRDRSRAPHHHLNAVRPELEEAIVELRRRYPAMGPRKLRWWLDRECPHQRWPAPSTIGEILKRYGLTVARKRKRRAEPSTRPFADCHQPNALWCADFKGWFRTGDGCRCDPLTISDAHSRYLLRCQALSGFTLPQVQGIFEAAFREYGLPEVIRTDNGTPFASTGRGGLSRLSLWWIKLGVRPERIQPGKPHQNGRHERMHLTLKQETASPPQATLRAQQRSFDRFLRYYNHDRPHEALGGRTPGDVYQPSGQPYRGRVNPVEYPDSMTVRKVQTNGRIFWRGRDFFVSEVLKGETVGLQPLKDDRYWTLHFSTVVLGVVDTRTFRVLTLREATRRIRNQLINNRKSKGGWHPPPRGGGCQGD